MYHGAGANIEMNKIRKCTFFFPDFSGGGAERNLITVANYIVDKGENVDILVLNSNGPLFERVDKRIRIVNLNCKRALQSIFKLRHYLRINYPDSFVSTLTHINLLSAILVDRNKTSLILREANTIYDALEFQSLIKRKIWLLLIRLLYRRANRIIAISNDVKESIQRAMGKNHNVELKVIFNPAVTSEIAEQSLEAIGDNFFLSEKTLVSVGRLVLQKNYSCLLRSFSILSQKYPEYRLAILGEGNEREKLQKQIYSLQLQEKVKLYGFMNNPFKYIKNAKLFVLASSWEGFGNVIAESLFLETPCVVTNCSGGPREMIKNGVNGYLCEVDNDVDLAQKIDEAININWNKDRIKETSLPFRSDTICNEYYDFIFQEDKSCE